MEHHKSAIVFAVAPVATQAVIYFIHFLIDPPCATATE